MKVNRKLFEIEALFTMSQAIVWDMTVTLNDVKKELQTARDLIIENTFEFDQNVEEISEIDEQMIYVNKNLAMLEKVLLHHESKIFKAIAKEANQEIYCLN